MMNDKGILIRNIYYMLTYAFKVLRQSNYEMIAGEDFENIQNLMAEILIKGIAQQLKQGLYKEYADRSEILPGMHGKLKLQQTIQLKMQKKQLLACEFDELTENNLYNQIIKTTACILIREKSVDKLRRSELKKEMVFFEKVDILKPSDINWGRITYQKSNRNYEMLLNICYFVLDGMLLTTQQGEFKMMSFSDEHMARLYEKFVLEYYRYHHSYLTEIKAAQIKWDLGETEERMIHFLPVMQTDIMLRNKERVLIIDTKYYGKTMQVQFDKHTIHSNNIYQIFTYVKNLDVTGSGNISGLLLYAKTEETITPDCDYMMGRNLIGIKTLDLNNEFSLIAQQLDGFLDKYINS